MTLFTWNYIIFVVGGVEADAGKPLEADWKEMKSAVTRVVTSSTVDETSVARAVATRNGDLQLRTGEERSRL